MRRRWLAVFALIAALVWITPTASADHGKGDDRGNRHAAGRSERSRADRDDARWERHDKFEVRTYGVRDGRPPGWSRGEKTGWGNCGMPPGHARKGGCRTYVYQERRYYYYRDDVGRIFVRRPVIEINAIIR